MDDRGGGRGGRLGGAPAFRRNYDEPRGGGGGDADGRGYGRGRGRTGRGRGFPNIFTTSTGTLPSRDRTNLANNPVHTERFQPSPTAARARSDTVASESPDQSGYESGEIMPGPVRPVAVRRGSNTSGDRGFNYHSSNASLGSGRGGGPGRSLDGRGPGNFGGRGRGRSYVELGGGHTGMGRSSGRGEDGFSGQQVDYRRLAEPPREVEIRKDPPPFLRDNEWGTDRSLIPQRDNGGNIRSRFPDADRGGPGRIYDGSDERFGKRPRDDIGYQADHDDKRPRGNDNGADRSRSMDDGRPIPMMESRSRPVDDVRRIDERRAADERRHGELRGGNFDDRLHRDDRRDRLGGDDENGRYIEGRGRIEEPSRGPALPFDGPRVLLRDDNRGPTTRDDMRGLAPRYDIRGPPVRDDFRGPPARDDIRGPPARDDIRGPPARDDFRGPPSRDDMRGPPSREDMRGPPTRDDVRWPPGREDTGGPPTRDDMRRLPVRDEMRGLPVRDEMRGPPGREDMRGPPPRDDLRSLPLRDDMRSRPLHDDMRGPPRDDVRGPPPRVDDMRVLPPREDMGGPPPRDDKRSHPLRDNMRTAAPRDDLRGPPPREEIRSLRSRDDPRVSNQRVETRGPPPREDMHGPPSREDMRGPPTRDDLRGTAPWDDMRGLASRDDLRGPGPRDDLHGSSRGETYPIPRDDKYVVRRDDMRGPRNDIYTIPRDDMRGPPSRDDVRGPPPRNDVRGPPLREDMRGSTNVLARDEGRARMVHRDEEGPGVFRDDSRGRSCGFREGPGVPVNGYFREEVRDRSRGFRDEGHRPPFRFESLSEPTHEAQRRESRPPDDTFYRREEPRDGMREWPREMPPSDVNESRDMTQTLDDFGRGPPPSSNYDRTNQTTVEMDRGRNFRGSEDGFRDPHGSSQVANDKRSGLVGPPTNRNPMPQAVPFRHLGDKPFRDDQSRVDMPLSDPSGAPFHIENRGSFMDHVRGRGRGGRGGGMDRGIEGSSEFNRFASARGSSDIRSDRDFSGGPPSDRRLPLEDGGWNSRPDRRDGQSNDRPRPDRDFEPQKETKDGSVQRVPSSSGVDTTSVPVTEPEKPPVEIKVADEQPKPPRPLTPPPASKPSGVVMALARLADLEAQMEYAYVKHMQLVKRQRVLHLQTKVLEHLPVGLDAVRDELAAMTVEATANAELYQ